MSSIKKRVLILSPFFKPNIGGVENYLDDLCGYLRTHGYMVYVITYQPLTVRIKAKAIETGENIEIRRTWWFGYNLFHKLEPYPVLEFIYLTPRLFIYTFLFMLKNNKKIDVVHAQGMTAAFIAKLLAKVFKKRTIMSTCAIYNLKKNSLFSKMAGWTLSTMDKILPLADFSKQELIRIGLPEDKMQTYYLWVDQAKYAPADKKTAKVKVDLRGRFIVLFVGRFIKIKGVEVLIEVAKTCDKNISFVFIGDQGPFLNYMENQANKYGNIVLVKGISGHQLIPYYQAADVLVVPSQYEEAFGKVIIEALSCGTPVIGANRGAVPHILSEQVGRVVLPTAENIKREIEYLYHHPAILSEMTGKCREYAEKNFGEKNIEVITRSYYS
jgi:glycosyltransferase involved in cell wall biosynthesis